jgi:integrase
MKGKRRHGTGWQVRVSVAGAGRSCTQFPLEATEQEMQAWQEDERYRLLLIARRHRRDGTQAGTFAADAKRYLKAVAAMRDIKNRRKDIALWVQEFGPRRRHSITADEIRAVRDRWLTVGPKHVYRKATRDRAAYWEPLEKPLAGSTVNHRLRALSNLWTVLDGRRAPNPVREVPEADETPELPRAIDYETITRILEALPDRGRPERHQKRSTVSLTKLRLRVMAWTGLPPAELMRLTAEHVDLERGAVLIEPRQKGKGVEPARLPLLPQAVEAFRDFAAANAWGKFSTSSVRQSFIRATRNISPAGGLRPYDLRHSFGTQVFLSTGSLHAVGELLRHADKRTSRRYTLAAVDPVLRSALAAWPGQASGPKDGNGKVGS